MVICIITPGVKYAWSRGPCFLVTAQLAPTLGAHPDKLEWFHFTRIHTIVNERLVNIESYY